MGGKSAPAPPPPPPGPDWAAIMKAEREANERQFNVMRQDTENARMREEQRRLQEEARREQERRDLTQTEKDRKAREQADAASQAAAAQATGTVARAAMPKLTQAAQAAPGLSPTPVPEAATRFGNIFYSPTATRLGGS
jgi:cell division protein FtsN